MQFLVRFLAGPRHYRPSINGDAPRLDASPTLFLDRPSYAFPLTLYHRLLCDGISKWKRAMDRVGRLNLLMAIKSAHDVPSPMVFQTLFAIYFIIIDMNLLELHQ